MRRFNNMLVASVMLACLSGTALAQDVPPPGAPTLPDTGAPHRFRDRFAAANATHDGHLTEAQAEAGGLRKVARNFAAIDTDHKGYVTLQDVQAWRHALRAAQPTDDAK